MKKTTAKPPVWRVEAGVSVHVWNRVVVNGLDRPYSIDCDDRKVHLSWFLGVEEAFNAGFMAASMMLTKQRKTVAR